ncbi:MAG: hypothetical protein ACI9TV_002072 [Sulfurimonas sp.]|jgi:hypothetical protein|uniref:hypothetical protein n=1 Tax=Sulfurimonas sp. TaxID=2022749 RepID=UPI0039E4E965
MILFKKALLLVSAIIISLTINSHYHVDVKKHHQHAGSIHMSTSQTIAHMNLHLDGHVDSQKSFGIIGGIIILLVLFSSKSFFFFILSRKKVISYTPKVIFYDQTFVDPPTAILQSILFHAPPR